MLQVHQLPNNWQGFNTLLGDRDSRKVAHNTVAFRDGASICVKYHRTVIAVFTLDTVTFNTGGWTTATTKTRINAMMPSGWMVYQQDHRWYVKHRNCEPFSWYDGIKLSA